MPNPVFLRFRQLAPVAFLAAAAAGLVPVDPVQAQDFVTFESGQVRPLALSPDGTRLFAINTPDNRLEIFDVSGANPVHVGAVAVGLEPIAVAARSSSEVWVVNHLSDSVSIVDVSSAPARVVRTLQVCDEPRDIVFAGPGGNRAFITAARRGQNCPVNSNLTTEGIGRAILQVFDATNLGNGLVGNTIANLELFADTPRALARDASGSTVYAAAFHSGNRTTVIGENLVCDGGASAGPCSLSGANVPGGLPAPNENAEMVPGPEVGLIVKFDPASGQWRDELSRNWSSAVRFDLPDTDVFAINANATPPVQTASFAGVGTVLFNMETNPVTGALYVSNTEARNEVRFEGPGLAFGSTTVQGHLHEARVTVIEGGVVTPRHLNKHIDYSVRPASPAVSQKSLATPLGMAVTGDGSTMYVAAFGSNKIGVFSTSALEDDTFVPDAASHIFVSGGGPTGIVLDETGDRLFTLTRFDNSLSMVRLSTASEIAHVALFNPEPAHVVDGRPFLYDAAFTSSNGEASCASCHIFGDLDSLAWDLGNPDDEVLNNPLPFRIGPLNIPKDFHPLKGPMTTQSLRGMANHGSMHWRGDRTGGNDVGGSAFDEDAAFKKFNPAFVGLIGRASELSAAEMQAYTDFILDVTYPPNPVRRLDNTFTSNEQAGHDLYFGRITDLVLNCNGCHTLDPGAGFFGSDGFGTFEGESQMFKVAHLRNMYQKVGMFGVPPGANTGPQVRGFGYLHDGSVDTIFSFLSVSLFSLSNAEQTQLQRFMLAFDSNLAPVVGQQTTLTPTSPTGVTNRIDLLLARDDAFECEVVVKGTIAGEQRGAYRLPVGLFRTDRSTEVLTDAQLRAFATTAGQELTYTCVPPGSGERIGIDRDRDGYFDRDELDLGSNPSDGTSVPPVPTPTPPFIPTPTPTQTPVPTPTPTPTPIVTPTPTPSPIPFAAIRATNLRLSDDDTPPLDAEVSRFSFRSSSSVGAPSGVTLPPRTGVGDPTTAGPFGGGKLTIHRADGLGAATVITLPATLWTATGSPLLNGYRYRDARRTMGPITSVTLHRDRLTIRGRGAGLFGLEGAPHGPLVVRVQLGGATEMCAVVSPRVPVAAYDTTARFVGAVPAVMPVTCPPVP